MTFLCLILSFAFAIPQQDLKQEPATTKTMQSVRKFKLNYGAKIEGLPANADVKVWVPVARSNIFQQVQIVKQRVPGKFSTAKGKQYGNLIGHFATNAKGADSVDFNIEYDVIRNIAKAGMAKTTLNQKRKDRFLTENKFVPTKGKPTELLSKKKLPEGAYNLGKELYEIVETYMAYDKSKPGYGNGDVLWACSSKTGNCTDFHSLFISLARNQNIPAKFEIGFPIPADKNSGKIGGYHCWAWFHTDELGWVPVDISEADKHPELKEFYFGQLTADRIGFSIGRDIELVPKSNSEPLNYFVYPHVEVNGKQWPKEKIELNFSFESNSSS